MVVNKKMIMNKNTDIFNLESDYAPMGDQPTAISELVTGVKTGRKSQVLLGVTGSGKTFTMANVIQQLGRPAMIMAPNKINPNKKPLKIARAQFSLIPWKKSTAKEIPSCQTIFLAT